jgi:hypothetical protein
MARPHHNRSAKAKQGDTIKPRRAPENTSSIAHDYLGVQQSVLFFRAEK